MCYKLWEKIDRNIQFSVECGALWDHLDNLSEK